MSKLHVSIGPGGVGTVVLDGRDISGAVQALRIEASAQYGETVVELTLCVSEVEITTIGQRDREMRVHISRDTRDTLISCGWTPPENETNRYTVPSTEWELFEVDNASPDAND